MRTTPQQSATLSEQAHPAQLLPTGSCERFAGYAVMGMPFSSGHYLAFRRFPASSVGPGYHAVWLRSPDGRWTFHADQPAEFSCARYFGAGFSEVHRSLVAIHWADPWQLEVEVPGVVQWELEFATTGATSAATAMARHMPAALWSSDRLLGAMGTAMGPMLRTGHMALAGRVPNGQSFRARPLRVWAVKDGRATVAGKDVGTPQPLPQQERLADFWLPQRGLFAADLAISFPSTAPQPAPQPSPHPGSRHETVAEGSELRGGRP